MGELLDAAVSPANIIITALFVFIVIYWITVIIGVLDVDFMDFDIDIDADAEVDGLSVTWLNSVLAFFNLGQVPVMIFFTFLIIPAWAISVIVNDFIGNSTLIVGVIVLLGSLFVSLFVAKILTIPFIKLFGRLGKDEERDEVLIGKMCTVTITARENKTGQAHVLTDGAPHLLNVRTSKGHELKKGDTGLVIEYNKKLNVYLIEPYN
ncbi:DUF1449 family protein [Fulvivirga sp. RKSG066]|uniref:OB-fold-containig protein n=1 Tax=Fulvivirga aurantia TaxID=2529383 RepID=UPI0012BCA7A3|nr:OB-fold-containig protein [Fulvivirga aurantia]MTI21642.1 DUF1449 family protein [Fulvivirga aurantia]